MLRQEAEAFFGAVRFFTRLPVPAWVGHSQEALDRAARYFPLVGILVGVLGGLTFLLAAFVLPVSLALLFSMAATLLVTGAFHEDGLADVADGLGGSYDRERALDIMKDSRIGAFGAMALVLALLAKLCLLALLGAHSLQAALAALVGGHVLGAGRGGWLHAVPLRERAGKQRGLSGERKAGGLLEELL